MQHIHNLKLILMPRQVVIKMGLGSAFKNMWDFVFKGKTKSRVLQNSFLYESSFGNDVYVSDIVQACIHAIAEETSKMIIKSVRVKNGIVTENHDDLNTLFRTRPNELMTMKDMIYWTVSRLEKKSNAYLLPEVEITTYADGSQETRVLAIYPINSASEQIVFDPKTQKHHLIFNMKDGGIYNVAYDEIIHLRKHFSDKSYYFGSTERRHLLQTLKIMDQVTDLLPKAINASMQLKGILTAKSQMDLDALKKYKGEFVESMRVHDDPFGVMDVAGTFTPVTINPQLIDKNTLDFLEKKILMNFGVPIEVLLGNATENTWSSFYQKNIEPFKIAFEQAATTVLFTKTEIAHGNKIRAYDRLVQHYTISTRLQIIDKLGKQNYLSRAEQRELVGYEPDGGPEKVSLNYIDQDKANDYQGVGGTNDESSRNEN